MSDVDSDLVASGSNLTFRIVRKGPSRRLDDRLRPASAVAGSLLLILSAMSVMLVGPLIVTFALQTFTPGARSAAFLRHVPTDVRGNLWAIWPLLVISAPGALLGQKLLGGRRKPVLFLRKFAQAEATSAITRAVRGLGQRWMFITLDDGAIAPVQTSAVGARAAATLGGIVAEIAEGVIPFLAKTLRLLFFVSLGGTVAMATVSLFRGGFAHGAIVGQAFEIVWVCGVILVASFVTICAGLYIWIIAHALFDDLDESGTTRRHSAASVADLVRARENIVDKRLSFFGARLTVLTVDTAKDPDLWRLAVGGFSVDSALPLIDVSQPTIHIEWELTEMLRRFGERCVLTGDEQRLVALQQRSDLGPFNDLMAGRDVLAYSLNRRGIRRFTRALRATVEARDRLPRRNDQDDPLTDPVERKSERARALLARADLRNRHHLEIPGAVLQAREAEALFAELSELHPTAFAAELEQARNLRQVLEARPDAVHRQRALHGLFGRRSRISE